MLSMCHLNQDMLSICHLNKDMLSMCHLNKDMLSLCLNKVFVFATHKLSGSLQLLPLPCGKSSLGSESHHMMLSFPGDIQNPKPKTKDLFSPENPHNLLGQFSLTDCQYHLSPRSSFIFENPSP
jgi:hypothetical protein